MSVRKWNAAAAVVVCVASGCGNSGGLCLLQHRVRTRDVLGHLAGVAVEPAVVDVEHRVAVVDRGNQQAFGVVGIARRDAHQAGLVHEHAFGRLAVVVTAANAAAKADLAELWGFGFIQGYKNVAQADMEIPIAVKPQLLGAVQRSCGNNRATLFMDLTALVADKVKLN